MLSLCLTKTTNISIYFVYFLKLLFILKYYNIKAYL